MPILVYCATLQPPIPGIPLGMGGAEVLPLGEGQLAAYYSEVQDTSSLASAEKVKQAALDFHTVITGILSATATLPLRFPTLLSDVEELRQAVRDRHDEFVRQLRAMGDAVQMEIHLTYSAAADEQVSGTEYLRQKSEREQKLRTATDLCRVASASVVLEWRSKEARQGIKLLARVRRSEIQEFRERTAKIALPSGTNGRVSGPWCAVDFVELAEACLKP